MKLLLCAGLLIPVSILFAYDSDWARQGHAITEALVAFDQVAIPKLIKAAQEGDLVGVKSALQEPNVIVDEEDKYGSTALEYAVEGDYKEVIKLLLAHKADPHSVRWHAETALRKAVRNGNEAMVKQFLAVDSNSKEQSMNDALVEAAKNNNTTLVKLLLANGAHPSSTANVVKDSSSLPTESTALIEAVCSGNVAMASMLIDAGADVNATDSTYGLTALMYAAEKGDSKMVSILLNSNADATYINYNDTTALKLAQNSGSQDTVTLIQNHLKNIAK